MSMDNVKAGLLLQFLESPVWYEVEKQLMLVREGIIAKGKKARNEGKYLYHFAELEGADKIIKTIHSIAEYREQTDSREE